MGDRRRSDHRSLVPAGCPLTNRQFDVLSSVARGQTYDQIARRLCLTESAVRGHACSGYRVLGVSGPLACGHAVRVLKDSGWLGALPRPQRHDDSRDVTPIQRAYNVCWVDLCRERTARAAQIVTIAFGLLAASHRIAPRPRTPPDIDELLLRMARGLMRPI